ncbi:MAG: 6-phosphogluconolactonase [Anaerolineales bacterium]|jgi:6-phosphogluconolactonase|nr:6-phosphogluconolactonase [Chloroflexota bacterium]MBK6646116.1 6-phosphogluconolactonase [Anaerolineales bacterium]MCC6985160.1 6-phosphogluconolactonase [Anaerolineales bacterium]
MLIKRFRNSEELSQFAAKSFIELANKAIAERGRFLISLSGGSTPMKLYAQLANETLDWSRVHFFWGDERCVPVDDPGNTYGVMRGIFFDKIGTTNIHRVESTLEPASAAQAYAHTLSGFADAPFDFPRFDLVLLGMGDDGHTASLFPGSQVEIASATIAVTAHYQDRPANRVSLTAKVFNQAREIWFLVTGAGKAETLRNVIKGERNLELYPAQRIQPVNGNLIWMIDEAAGRLLN